jgi:hypothetical protein
VARPRSRTRLLAVGSAVMAGGIASACVKSPTAPAPAPLLDGDYVLSIDASDVCHLPTMHFQWTVQARTVGSGVGAEVRVTLPAGNDAIDLSLTYATDPNSTQSAPPADRVRGSLNASRAPFHPSRSVTISSQAQGTVTDAGGRGKIEGGTFNGTLSLTDKPPAEDPAGDALGSCTAADHHWSLVTP